MTFDSSEGRVSSRRENSVVRVSFSGGLLGVLFGSYRGRLEKAISEQNRKGWHVVEVIPDTLNFSLVFVRLVLLICTLGLWTLSSSLIVIFERERRREEEAEPEVGGRVPGLVARR